MAVVVPTDLESILHIDIGNNSDPKVVAIIARAQDAVEGVLGRKIEQTEVVDTFRGNFRALILSAWPVISIDSVEEDGVALTVDDDFRFDENGVIVRYRNGDPRIWERTDGDVVVTYDAGFISTHVGYRDLAGVVLRVAGRMFQAAVAFAAAPDGADALRQESLGSYSVTYATDSDSPVTALAALTEEDLKVVNRWR